MTSITTREIRQQSRSCCCCCLHGVTVDSIKDTLSSQNRQTFKGCQKLVHKPWPECHQMLSFIRHISPVGVILGPHSRTQGRERLSKSASLFLGESRAFPSKILRGLRTKQRPGHDSWTAFKMKHWFPLSWSSLLVPCLGPLFWLSLLVPCHDPLS